MVTLHALGDCRIQTPEGVIRPRATQLFGLATYLIVERGKLVPRRRLMSLFWPERSEEEARPLLREALRKLRRKGVPLVGDDDSFHVRLPKQDARIDVYDVEFAQLRTCSPHGYAAFPGYEPDLSAQLRDWVDDVRGMFHTTIVAHLSDALEQARLRAEWSTVLDIAGQTLALDPDHVRAQEMAAYARKILEGRRCPDSRSRYGTLVREGTTGVGLAMVRETPVPHEEHLASRDTTLVGRADDLALLTTALHHAKNGTGGGCYLHGPPGIGKSRLVRELVSIARPDGFAIRSTTCQPQDVHRPLSVFVDMIPGLRQLPGASGCFPHTHAYLDRLTRHGSTVSIPDAEAREGEYLYEHIRRALFDLVEAVTEEQPVLFIVENIQWSDPQSWALLRDLCARAVSQSIIFVFTSREPWNTATDGPVPSYVTSHRLDAIESDAALQHAEEYAATFNTCTPDSAMLAWCARIAEGNPYFTEELLNHWGSTGEPFSAPATLTALITTRIQRLSETSLRLLQACAILNKNSTLVRLRAMLEYPEYRFLSAVEELVQAGMLTTDLSTATGVYNQVMCRHDLLADQAIQQLSPHGRQLLHHRAGTILDTALDQPAAIALVWDCAQHWYAAGNTARAVELGLVCATHLTDLGLARDAATVCQSTLEFCTTPADQLAILTTHIRALHIIGDHLKLPKLFEDIRSLRAVLGQDITPHDDLELLEFDAGWTLYQEPKTLIARAECCVNTTSASLAHRIEAGLILFKIGANTGDLDVMHRVYHTLAPYNTNIPENENSLTFEIIYHATCGDLDVCITASQRLIQFSRNQLRGTHRLRGLLNGAKGLAYGGQRSIADSIYTEVFGIAVSEKAMYRAANAAQELIWNNTLSGNLDEAKIWAKHFESLDRPANERWGKKNFIHSLARIAFESGNTREAELLLQPYVDTLVNDSSAKARSEAFALVMRLQIAHQADVAIISTLVEKLYTEHLQLRTRGQQDFATFSLYLGLIHTNKGAEALDLLTEYVHVFRRDRDPLTQEIISALETNGQGLVHEGYE